MLKKLLLLLLFFNSSFIFGQGKETLVSLETDSYPNETYWILMADSLYGDTIYEVPPGHYTQPNTGYVDTCYIPDSVSTIVFLLRDTYGDGMDGSYYVAVCGDTIINKPTITFNSGIYQTRMVPPCFPNPPPPALCLPAKVIINLDQYQSETSWEITDSLGFIVASGGGYNAQPDYGTVIVPVCLPLGPLNFTIFDAYGDGMQGSLWQGQDGSYFVKQCNDTLVYGTDPAFGLDSTHAFVIDSCPPIYGCTDDDYVEWNPFADTDDGSCQTLKIFGCIDSTMYNYDPNANTMDLIPQCEFTLVLHDLMGNGWIGSNLELLLPDTSFVFTHLGGFNQEYQFTIDAPDPATFRFNITPQASLTTIECGFTLMNPEGDTLISIQPPFIQPLFPYSFITNCGNTCIEKVFGCTDPLALNFDSLANTDDTSCYYVAGCMNPLYLEYDSAADYDDGSCATLIVLGCMDSTALNYDPLANVELQGSCIAIVEGCTNPLAFNYNINANVDDSTCIPVIDGCTNPIALNYNSAANTDDGSCILPIPGCTDPNAFNYDPLANVEDSSCIAIVYGCTDPTMWNFNALANVDNGSCEPFVYGCMDSTMFNYNPIANTSDNNCIPYIYGCTDPVALNYCDSCNTDDFSCILPIYGCTDSTMFNYNPLANVDNNTCIPYIYGCTDPSMLNYNSEANTEDFSCIPFIYGCTDSTALNYDPLANTENGSCIEVVTGCMDQTAWNYEALANVNDSLSCLYDAACITGPGNPYWLNDPCYAWVISVDDYCCENEWDTICQATYDYCGGNWTGPQPPARWTEQQIYIYPNPTTGIVKFNLLLDVTVYNNVGKAILQEKEVNIIDISSFSKGIYHFAIKYQNKIVNYNIIKN